MEANVAVPSENKPTWGGGGVKPFGASFLMPSRSLGFWQLTV